MFVFKLIAGVIANVAIFGGPLFLLAGTWDWWRAWVLLGTVFIGSTGSVMTLPRALLEERLKPPVQKGQPLADKIVLILLVVMFTALIVFIPLDVFRFQLLAKPSEAVSGLGLILFVSGWWIAYLALKQNAFAAPVVKHQTERDQVVIDTGVYGLVRHPMYSGGALVMIGMPLWLESYAAALFAIVPITALIIRIRFEEEFLKRELKGYRDYIDKVRYRLIPLVW
jgi:protein-S-isoprenylcysteine O-methyltransferase Ste14